MPDSRSQILSAPKTRAGAPGPAPPNNSADILRPAGLKQGSIPAPRCVSARETGFGAARDTFPPRKRASGRPEMRFRHGNGLRGGQRYVSATEMGFGAARDAFLPGKRASGRPEVRFRHGNGLQGSQRYVSAMETGFGAARSPFPLWTVDKNHPLSKLAQSEAPSVFLVCKFAESECCQMRPQITGLESHRTVFRPEITDGMNQAPISPHCSPPAR